MIENEYRHNRRFREFVDGYCEGQGITVDEAFSRDEIKQVFWRAFWHYTEL